MKFMGAEPDPALVASGGLPGTVNYLTGSDPSRWQTHIPTYSRVTYQEVWNGIDVAFYGNQRSLEYDFQVAPGADPNAIALSFDGAEALRLTPEGDLLIPVSGELCARIDPSPTRWSTASAGSSPATTPWRGGG